MDVHPHASRGEAIRECERAYRFDNREHDREVLPQRAVAELFGITATAVRAAVRNGHVTVAFRLSESLGGRRANLIDLQSALGYWRQRSPDVRLVRALRADLDDRLRRMRANCTTIAMPYGPEERPTYIGFNILNVQRSTSLILDDAEDLAS